MYKKVVEYTIYLPLTYNDGIKIEEEKFELTYKEIGDQFGGFTEEKENEGYWLYHGKLYKDKIHKIYVLTCDTHENDEWFKNYKEILKERFEQIDILITKTATIDRL